MAIARKVSGARKRALVAAGVLPEIAYMVIRIERVGTCWEWTGATNGIGYGVLHRDGGTNYAHRWMYEHLVGPIPTGLYIDHLCRNTICCNPEHLEPVTPSENTRRSPLIGLKTRCAQGHLFSSENTYVSPAGARSCRTCRRRRMQNERRKGT